MTSRFWQTLRWIAIFGFVFSTIMMLSPHAASISITPWILYIVGNLVLTLAAFTAADWPLFTLCLFYFILDVLILLTRVGNYHLFDTIQPLLTILDKLP